MDSILCQFAVETTICLPFNPLPSAPVSFSRVSQISSIHNYISVHCLDRRNPSLRCRWALQSRKYVARAFECHREKLYTSATCKGHSANRARLRFDTSIIERSVSTGFTTKRFFLANINARNSPRLVRMAVFKSPQGGGSGGGKVFFNLAVAGLLTYLTVTGKLNWLFEAILYIWIFFLVLFWVAERNLVRGRCPSCGGEFQVFEFALKDGPRLCPYCSQPFKMENKQFVREGPQFSNERRREPQWPFGGFGQQASSTNEQKTSDGVVDIEAEVRDKD